MCRTAWEDPSSASAAVPSPVAFVGETIGRLLRAFAAPGCRERELCDGRDCYRHTVCD